MSQIDTHAIRTRFIANLSQISEFWGLPRALGAIFGALYLSPQPLSLDALVEQAGVTKGAVSTHVRALERMGMVHKQVRVGERRDYYEAETDFWKIGKGLLEQRRKAEFDRALRGVTDLLQEVKATPRRAADAATAAFYQGRLQSMEDFFKTLDSIVATLLQLDQLRSGGLQWLRGPTKKEGRT